MHDYVNLSKAGWDKAAIVNELLTKELRGGALNEGRELKKTLESKSKSQLKADLETALVAAVQQGDVPATHLCLGQRRLDPTHAQSLDRANRIDGTELTKGELVKVVVEEVKPLGYECFKIAKSFPIIATYLNAHSAEGKQTVLISLRENLAKIDEADAEAALLEDARALLEGDPAPGTDRRREHASGLGPQQGDATAAGEIAAAAAGQTPMMQLDGENQFTELNDRVSQLQMQSILGTLLHDPADDTEGFEAAVELERKKLRQLARDVVRFESAEPDDSTKSMLKYWAAVQELLMALLSHTDLKGDDIDVTGTVIHDLAHSWYALHRDLYGETKSFYVHQLLCHFQHACNWHAEELPGIPWAMLSAQRPEHQNSVWKALAKRLYGFSKGNTKDPLGKTSIEYIMEQWVLRYFCFPDTLIVPKMGAAAVDGANNNSTH